MSMVSDNRFATLVAQVRDGSQEAAWELVELYGPHILHVVRRSLSREIRPKFDSQDFVQAVWASFFSRDQVQFFDIDRPEQLIGVLAAIAKHKIIDEVRRRLDTEKHNIRRELSLNDLNVVIQETLASNDPTPSEVAIAKERWTMMLESQPESYREIVNLRFAGETHEAIARKLGISSKTVQRVLRRLLQEGDSRVS